MGPKEFSIVLFALLVSLSRAQYLVGVSGTTGGNAPGQNCAFDFIYRGMSYSECITNNNYDIPWCATTSNYDITPQWANCRVTIRANRTKLGTSGRSTCNFPFKYNGIMYNTCITNEWYSNKPWCATSEDYDRDRRWAECVRYSTIYTTGGTGIQGAKCVFPFWYRGRWHHGCITAFNNGVGWCATTRSYDEDRQWGNCVVSSTDTGNTDPNCPNGNTYSAETNTLSYGGVEQSGANTVAACQRACDIDAACIGFDYDNNILQCFKHTSRSLFDVKQRGPNVAQSVVQYTLTNRCTTNPTTGGGGNNIVLTRGGNAGGQNRCVFPFWYGDVQFSSCTSINWYTPWCAVTGNYNNDRLWGECSNIATE